MAFKKEPIVWYLVIGCFIGVIVQIVLFFTSGASWLVNDEEPQPDQVNGSVDPERPTPYQRDIAAALAEDPVWIDPLIAGSAGEAWVDDAVRRAVANSDTPVYVVVAPRDEDDGNRNNMDLANARIAHVVGDEAVYFLINGSRVVSVETFDNSDFMPEGVYTPEPDSQALVRAIESVDREKQDASQEVGGSGAQILGGAFLGVPWLVVGWFVSRWITRAGRRNTNYLEGFNA